MTPSKITWFEAYVLSKLTIRLIFQLTEYVVPKSSSVIFEEGDNSLVNVTLFRRVVDDFKAKAREARFVVKDFEWDSERVSAAEKKAFEMKTDMQKKYNALVKWCQTMFGEAFTVSSSLTVARSVKWI